MDLSMSKDMRDSPRANLGFAANMFETDSLQKYVEHPGKMVEGDENSQFHLSCFHTESILPMR